MKRSFLCLFVSLFFIESAIAQLKSPEEFLGYKIGTHFTPHWQIVNYFHHVALNAPAMMKLEEYGKTNEGRPLLLSYISTADNLQHLENIRLNNLRLANIAKDKMAANEKAPVIVWLSYNVHGNEASSSEAAMLTLYSLVDPANTKTKDWMKNTVIIIDPCINPDGRDRYVNWFNSVVGENVNPDPFTREHREPWPGGRTNHYNFDLNRDWAWQTQLESRLRIKKYNEWMPQIHVDFHEQGVNEPYYFAPAAQPYHNVITSWQREFQQVIGLNHAKYFDQNGWLYFTKEIFDLYYPSYGDTWPIYNGAIGMTYEQGGGPAGGLGITTDEGDTLTLTDRAIHHYTTSLSTIEVASVNAARLIKEYRKFFNDAVQTGVGDYKTYIIKNNGADEERISAFKNLLDKNGIVYGIGKGTFKAYRYSTGKEESVTLNNSDVVISSLQPRSVMVKVLFEPKPDLVDSNTYDITAWSLPYVYDLNGYATKEKIAVGPEMAKPAYLPPIAANAYGYIIRWQGMQSAKTVAQLLKKNIRMRFSESAFEMNGEKFDRGSMIILQKGNENISGGLSSVISEVANQNQVKVTAVNTGMVDKGYDFGSSKVHAIKAPRVVLLTGESVWGNSAGEVWHFFDKVLEYPVNLINANDFARVDLDRYDVVIMPGGDYKFLSDRTVADKFHEWINRGGKVIALEGAVAQLAKLDWTIDARKTEDTADDKSKDIYEPLRKYENRERDFIPSITPGSIFKVDLDNSHPLAFGYPDYYYTLKMDDAIYDFITESGWNVGVIKKESPVIGFVGSKLKQKLKDGLLFGVQDIGRGNIVYLVDDVLFRSFWENGKLMFCNALFLVGQ